MSNWSEFRATVGLPRGTRWAALITVLVLLTAGWLLQERVVALRSNDLDYSNLCRFVAQSKVALLVIKGQTVEGDFSEPQQLAGHQTRIFRTTMPSNDPAFWPLLREKGVRVRVVAEAPGLLARWAIGAVPLAVYVALGLWVSRRKSEGGSE